MPTSAASARRRTRRVWRSSRSVWSSDMRRRGVVLVVSLAMFAVATWAQQQTPTPGLRASGGYGGQAQQEATRPPENNDQMLRPLGPDEIPPNLSFYAMDPLYKPG